ncbi:MAG: phosphatase PAP2 family protein [Saprospiraceae bacterium]|nr:phosphatase PAP2 family protein [Saprospiraceae bacterium]
MKKITIFTLLAAGSAVFLMFSGVDWWWARVSWQYLFLQYAGIPSVFIGIILPVALPLYFYLNRKNQPRYGLLAAVSFRAFLWAWGLSTLLKSFTNRVPREPFEDLGTTDFSQQFRFGFLQGNNLWESLIEGFPSGHTMTAFAMSYGILPFLTSRKSKIWAIVYAVYIGLGVSVTVHWLSDAVTGGLTGYMIGYFVASKKYPENFQETQSQV